MDTTALWESFQQGVFRYVSARISNRADAEDVVQEIFLKIHDRKDEIRDSERVAGWVFRIASNAVHDHYRARKPQPDAVQPQPQAEELSEAHQELASCVKPFVQMLDEPYRDALLMTEFEGVSQVEAAHRAGISVSGMKSRVQRARKLLRGEIETCCTVDVDPRGGVVDYQIKNERPWE